MKRKIACSVVALVSTWIAGMVIAMVGWGEGPDPPWDGICPSCKEQGMVSKVYVEGCTSTLLSTIKYYDEKGEFHYEDPNRTTCAFTCSNGHHFSRSSR